MNRHRRPRVTTSDADADSVDWVEHPSEPAARPRADNNSATGGSGSGSNNSHDDVCRYVRELIGRAYWEFTDRIGSDRSRGVHAASEHISNLVNDDRRRLWWF